MEVMCVHRTGRQEDRFDFWLFQSLWVDAALLPAEL